MLTIEEIKSIIPQRYPFLLIDRVLEYQEGVSVVGIKNVTINEPFFKGHFPNEPIMPGVLILESMAQLSGCFLMGRDKALKGYVASVYNAMFFRPVVPGDQMILKVELTQQVRNLIKVKGQALVEEKRVAKAQLGFIVFTSDNEPIPELPGFRRD